MTVLLEPCLFPTLAQARDEVSLSKQTVHTQLTDGLELRVFCMRHGLKTFHVYQAAWIFLIQFFVESASVSFHFRTAEVDNREKASGKSFQSDSELITHDVDAWNHKSVLHILQHEVASFKDTGKGRTPIHSFSNGTSDSLCDIALEVRKHITEARPGRNDNIDNIICKTVTQSDQSSICLNIDEYETQIMMNLSYSNHKISKWHAENIIHTFNSVCSALIKHPSDSMGELDILCTRDRKQLFLEWNKKYPALENTCVHDALNCMIIKQPDAEAISSWEGRMTYHELGVLSSRLASHLIDLGVHAEVIVPLSFEKSMWAVVSMIGVLKAGGAYVSLNPDHPVARQERVVHAVHAKVILASASTANNLTSLMDHVIIVDESLFKTRLLLESVESQDLKLKNVGTRPENSALVVFTSGSTGVPKGIIQEHGAFCTGARDYAEALQINSKSRVLQFAAFTFDASNNDILATLMAGGCVCMPSETDRMNNLASTIRNLKANVVFLTPTVANLLNPAQVPDLHTLLLAGEPVTKKVVDTWSQHVRLVNIYGPAECCLWCTICPQMTIDSDPLNIGRQITDRCWIVNPNTPNQLAPLGAIGEILIEGHNVSRGYINNPEKTELVFIQKPKWLSTELSNSSLSRTPRFYMTGDLGRYMPDGSIVYIRRKDTQVKINGNRVEVAEIEHHLMRHLPEGMQFAVGIIKPEIAGMNSMLAAFIAFNIDQNSSQSDRDRDETKDIAWSMNTQMRLMIAPIQHQLGKVLPSYMVPSVFIPLKGIPLTTSGKTDRGALRRITNDLTAAEIHTLLNDDDSDEDGTRRLPITQAQLKMQQLWETVLPASKSPISLDDNFFRLRGDSITAMRLVSAAQASSIALTVADVFQHPTLEAMSAAAIMDRISHQQPIASFSLLSSSNGELESLRSNIANLCGLSSNDIEDSYPCTTLQQGLVALSIKEPGSYIGQHVVELQSDIDIARFRKAWAHVVQAVPILRTRIVQVGESSELLQSVVKDTRICWSIFDDLESCLAGHGSTNFEFGTPLSQFALINPTQQAECWTFVWTCHHVIYDGWTVSHILSMAERFYHNLPYDGTNGIPIEYINGISDGTHHHKYDSTRNGIPDNNESILQSRNHGKLANDAIEKGSGTKTNGISNRILECEQDQAYNNSSTDIYSHAGEVVSRRNYNKLIDDNRYDTSHNSFDDSRSGVKDRIPESESARAILPPFSRFVKYQLELDNRQAESFWRSYLVDLDPSSFPSYQAEKYQPLASAILSLQIPIMRSANDSGFTMPTFIRAAWSMVVAQYSSNSNDVVFGATLSGRNAPVQEIDRIIGPTIATVPVRVKVNKGEEITSLLRKIQADATAMIPYEHTGLQNIQRINSETRAACQFSNLLVIQPESNVSFKNQSNGSGNKNIFQKLDSTSELTNLKTYPLVIELTFNSAAVGVKVLFDDSLVGEKQMQRILHQFSHILQQLISYQPRMQVCDIETISPQDKVEIRNWNRHTSLRSVESCVHHLIEQQVPARPHSAAVCSWDGDLTYDQLNTLSSTLAHYLSSAGVKAETFVPICFEKSMWVVVAMLAVLKAGGAFLPLDPLQPVERLRNILRKAQPIIMLSSAMHFERCLAITDENLTGGKIEVIPVHASRVEELAEVQSTSPAEVMTSQQRTSADHTAYVLFTSGSTGLPKGVLIGHRAVSSSISAFGANMLLSPSTRALQFASHTFDAVIAEVLGILVFGGCVCVPSELDRMNNLASSMERMKVNWAFFTPSVLRLLQPQEVPHLKILILGGEALSNDLTLFWRDHVTLIEGYGPTECCIFCLSNNISQTRTPSNIIGSAIIGGCLTWVVDPSDSERLTPIGAVGELVIQGPILAKGYLDDVNKTAMAFVEAPSWLSDDFNDQTHRHEDNRIYKTGDLVEYRSDGLIRYIGRKDNQIKLRGQRIELSEIEHHLRNIRNSPFADVFVDICKPTDRPDSEMRIVAFMSTGKSLYAKTMTIGSPTDADGLEYPSLWAQMRKELGAVLPRYMIPSIFIPLRNLPLTTSGKVSRTDLSQFVGNMAVEEFTRFENSSAPSLRPATTSKQIGLRKLWSEVLTIDSDEIGLDANFFRLGGDSINAMLLVAIARSRLKLSLTVADIFLHPTLESMSQAASNTFETRMETPSPFSLLGGPILADELRHKFALISDLHVTAVEDLYPSTALQEGLMLLSAKQPGAYVTQQILPLHDNVNLDRFKAAWEDVVLSTPILRTRLAQIDNHEYSSCLQGVVKGSIDWTTDSDLSLYLEKDKANRMQFGSALSRFAVITSTQKNKITRHFVLTLHHSVYDGWSLPRILSRVDQKYYGIENEQYIRELAPFSSFIKHTLDHNNTEEMHRFWRSVLSEFSSSPFPRPVKNHQPQANAVKSQDISFGRPTGSEFTVSTMIRAAWALLVARHSNSDDIVFGATLTGRNAQVPYINEVIGPTIVTVPVRVKITDYEQEVVTFLKIIQAHATEMIAYEQMGLQNIQRLDQNARSACDFQNLLVIQPHSVISGPAGDAHSELERSLFHLLDSQADILKFSTYPLMMECSITASGAHVNAVFDSNILSSAQMQRVLDQFAHILKQISSASNGMKLQELELISPQDKIEIASWNNECPDVVNSCVHHLIESQAEIQPDSPAIEAWDGRLTYQELNNLSSKLARYLSTYLGVGPEAFVPLCFEKSKWTVVATFGILKAGGAFVPLDPSSPTARLQGMLSATKPSTLLCSALYKELCLTTVRERFENIKVVTLNAEWFDSLKHDKWIDRDSCTMNNVEGLSEYSTAYSIFTSGSTGVPKGVSVSHKSISSSSMAFGRIMKFRPSSRVFQFSAYTFDISLAEIITTLVFGGCICIPSDSDRVNNIALSMRQLQVNLAFLTTSVARLIRPEQVPFLDVLALAGEALTEDVVLDWREKVNLIGAYGPTECTVFCLIIDMSNTRSAFDIIGKASACRTWIADLRNPDRLAPVGTIGELVIEGPIVAKGYLNNIDKTRASFIENTKWLSDMICNNCSDSRRAYRTGDLAEYRPDGLIRYLGRKDTQVKLRGQRIELAEIELQLRQLNPSLDVAVSLFKYQRSSNPDTRLVAFISSGEPKISQILSMNDVQNQPSSILASWRNNICASLRTILPEYMIPSLYIPLAQIPLTTSGKLNRQALDQFMAALSDEELTSFEISSLEKRAPNTDVEVQVQRLWASILNTKSAVDAGLDDSFFKIGGDSIHAMRLVAAARADGLSLSVADIFENPTLEAMAKIVAQLDEEDKQEIAAFALLKPLDSVQAIHEEIQQICKTSVIEDIYPCTALQEGLMAISVRTSGLYCGQQVMEIPVSVDLERFKLAWDSTFQSTPILRTRIVQTRSAGCFQAVVQESIEWDSSDNLESYLANDTQSLMSFGTPLCRFAITKDAQTNSSSFVFTCHHALYDGWSLSHVFAKVEKSYAGEVSHSKPAPFKNYIKFLQEANPQDAESFWRLQLLDSTPSPIFCMEKDNDGQTQIDSIAIRDLRLTRANNTDITLSTVIRAAWAIIVGRYSDSNDVIFGATLSGRNIPLVGVENILGPTMATVPIRIKLNPDQEVTQFLVDVQARATTAIPYEYFGIQNIQRLSDEAQNACDFQTLLGIQQQVEGSDTSLFGKLKAVGDTLNFYVYPLTLDCTISSLGVNVHAAFNSRIIDKTQMGRILDQFTHLIEQLLSTESPGKLIRDLNLVSPQDRRQLVEWYRDAPVAFNECVHHSFERLAVSQPDAEAVISWDGSLTYGRLDQLSSKLACHLIKLGIQVEQFVAICFEKSIWAIVAMLGILKSGGAVACLNPTHPLARQRTILEDTKAQIILASPETSSKLEGLVDSLVVVCSSLFESMSMDETLLKSVSTGPENSAFVLFTSGSTGKPKGIIHEHRTFGASVREFSRVFELDEHSRTLQFASFTFDVSHTDIFTSLATGGCLCIPSDCDRINNLARVMREMKVTVACLTPSVAGLLTPEDVPCLRILSTAGEAMTKEIIRIWSSKLHLVNIYGPAECAVWSTYHPNMSMAISNMNIGRSVSGRCWIVMPDDPEKLAPIGTIGEVVIEGPHVARGYMNNEKKTNEVFLEKPAWMDSIAEKAEYNQRFYLSGDMARYDPNGDIIYVKRKDTQVKIYGQRIELGEVEHHLAKRMPDGLRFAVDVIKPESRQDTLLLAAFVAFNKPSDTNKASEEISWSMKDNLQAMMANVQSQLKHDLPRYMIPSVFLPMGRIPLTNNGKTDRSKLRELASKLSPTQLTALVQDPETKKERRAPYTETQVKMRRLWSDILRVDCNIIGLDDNFFRLGGDSISAMRLVSIARSKDLTISVADIFSSPTLEALSESIADSAEIENQSTSVEPFSLIRHAESTYTIRSEVATLCNLPENVIEDVYPSTALQEGFIVLSLTQTGAYVGQHVMNLPDDMDISKFRDAWNIVVGDTPILKTRIVQTQSHGCLQVVINQPVDWIESRNLNEYLCADEKIPMGLGSSLSRLAIIETLGGGQRHFVWTCHHAIFDGWSASRIFSRIEKLYKGEEGLGRIEIKSGVTAFNRFIQYTSGIDNEDAKSFWQSQLSNASPIRFPTIPARQSDRYQPLPDSWLVRDLPIKRAAQSEITLATIIRAAWAILVARYTSNDVTFGATLTGRNAPVSDIDKVLGPTVATVPIRVQVEPEQDVVSFLKAVQSQASAMIPYEHTGLQNIKQVSPEARAACDFQNLLVIQTASTMGIVTGAENTFFESLHAAGDLLNFSTYPLTVECTLSNDGINVNLMFDSRAIDKLQIERIYNQFAHILGQLAVIQPACCVKDIQIISPEDRTEILAWNDTMPETVNSCVHWMIEENVKIQPDAQAVCSVDGDLTYQELHTLSSDLAVYLKSLRIGPEVFVPLCFEKSRWVVVAMLAVLKAGAAFVPLEPNIPEQRLKSIVNEVKAKVILSSRKYASFFEGVPVTVTVDAKLFEVLPSRKESYHSLTDASPFSALYAIFTSGTTGTPKGVVIQHGSYCSGAIAQAKALLMTNTSRVLQFASHGFDTSIEEILTTLIVGGCICTLSDDDRENDIVGAMRRMKVNWADLTPSFLPLITPQDVPELQVLVLGGEPLNSNNIEIWAPETKLINAYGQTEACITSLANTKIDIETDPTNIGWAVGGLCWIAEPDDHEKLAPIGCLGELLIEGPILARGYLNRPEETKGVFIHGPPWLPSIEGNVRRLYKTGDLVQYLSDGSMKYMGRKDTQVKIRGQRVELNEIEHHLRRCVLGCEDAAAEVIDLSVGGNAKDATILVAFLCLGKQFESTNWDVEGSDTTVILNTIVAELSNMLPSYMVPACYIPLTNMPLTTSGKVDRKLLRKQVLDLTPEQMSIYIPRSDQCADVTQTISPNDSVAMAISTKLASLVGSNGLEISTEGRNVQLSRLGMDSIAMIRLASFINQSFEVRIGIQTLYDGNMTVRGVAQLIHNVKADKTLHSTQVGAKFDVLKEFDIINKELHESIAEFNADMLHRQNAIVRSVFITGATGFLGSQILRQFLLRPEVTTVIAHVRAETTKQGTQRIIDAAKMGQWWKECFMSKLQVWIGDLTDPDLGLNMNQWRRLEGTTPNLNACVDAIVHNGAIVNWNLDYETLKAANIRSSVRLLKAATINNSMKLVYISGGVPLSDEDREDRDKWHQINECDGYSQTKFISEQLIHSMRRRAEGKFSVVQPGLIIGTASEGVPNTDDFIWRLVASAINIGGYSAHDVHTWLPISSVDRVAHAVLDNTINQATVTSITDGMIVQEFWDIFSTYSLRSMDRNDWLAALRKDIDSSKDEVHPLQPVLHFVESPDFTLGGEMPPQKLLTSTSTNEIKLAVQKNVEYLVGIGFLPDTRGVKKIPDAGSDQGFKRRF